MNRGTDARPRHEQIAADLREEILRGDLAPGAQLPSTAQLMARFDAANATIQRALKSLKDEGFLDSRVGKGVYIRGHRPLVIDVGAYLPPDGKVRYDLLDVTTLTPPTDVATALNLDPTGQAVRRRRILYLDKQPVELSISYYAADLATGTPLARAGKIPGGAPQVLADLGAPQRAFVDRISARPPTREEITVLDLPAGVPVLRQFRTVLTDDDRPVEVSVLIKGAHLYELQYRQSVPYPDSRA
ncbi:GntR family transcriptional regulator [Antribacter sp. KLBMP9083]|uniref:GntR family transcriptional regulator n=1 Tax=Antribacter soli TaxID=2910976 RepID=A0AA41UAS5_9MICO|nr:GntR family transcriptional regulator [Antribacter soli]MCF4123002.1 GntR family transcriptional regulator [Antribacter soli]